MHDWISVDKELPPAGTVLLAGRMRYKWEHQYTTFIDLGYHDGDIWHVDNDWYEGQQEFAITHWMPLPDPPVYADGN